MAEAPVLLLHCSSDRYGADRQLLSLATGLDPARYRPIVALPERGVLAPLLEEAGVEVVVTPLTSLRRDMLRGRGLARTAIAARRSSRALGRLARERKVALVHTNTSILLGGQGAADSAGAPHVLHVREIYGNGGGGAADRLWPLLRRRMMRADGLACVSEAAANALGPSPQAFVLHDGVARTPVRAPRREAREALGIDPDRFAVGVVGRISDWKGQRVLVRALARPPLAEIGAIGILAGDAAPGQEHFRDELEELREELGIGNRLKLLGFQEDLGKLFGAVDAVAVPSEHPDALPNAALEAAAAGIPVVGSSNGGQPEILRDGVTGRLVSPGDDLALAETLRAVADDPGGAGEMGAAAAADVARRFDSQRMLEALQERYDQMCR